MKLKLIRWVLLVVILINQKSMANDDCTPVRLDETSMKAMPIYSQNDIGDCYAVATSQLVDAYRFSHGDTNTKHLTSFRAISVKSKVQVERYRARFAKELNHYIGKSEDRKWKKKYMVRALKNIKPHVLKKEAFASNLPDSGNVGGAIDTNSDSTGHFISCDQEVVAEYFEKNKNFDEAFDFWSQTLRPEKKVPVCHYESPALSELRPIIEALKKESNTMDFFDGVMAKICEKHSLKIKIPPLVTVSLNSNPDEVIRAHDLRLRPKMTADFKAAVNTVLSLKNPQPVSIGFVSNFLMKKNVPKDEIPDHASVIIGRRKNNAGQCEFLLRNSWGEKCDLVVECDPTKKGQYWIDADQLMSYTHEVNMLLDQESFKEFEKNY